MTDSTTTGVSEPAAGNGGTALAPRIAGIAAWFAFYLASAMALTWPLVAHAHGSLPDSAWACASDLLHIGWALAHQSTALLSPGTEYADARIYHPTPGSLFYGQTGIGALPLFAPVYLASGNPTLALNVLFLTGMALTALSLHLAVAHVTGSSSAGFVAGWTFLMCRWVFWTFVPSVPNYSLLFLFPVLLLAVSRPLPSFAAALRLVPLMVLQCLPDVAYIAFSLLSALGCVALLQLARRLTRASGLRLLGAIALTGLCLLPLYAAYLAIARENPDLATQTRWTGIGQRNTTFPWGFRAAAYPTSVPLLALPWIAAGGALTLHRWGRDGPSRRTAVFRVSFVFVVVGLVLSLTPQINWFGRPVRLPHGWLGEMFGFYERIRVPARLGISALLGLCMLAGLATAEITARLESLAAGRERILRTVVATIVGIVWTTQALYGFAEPLPPLRPLAYPLRQPPSPRSRLVQALSAGRGPVLELPVDPRKPSAEARAMYRGIFHGRRLVNGYHGYWPLAHERRVETASSLPDADALARLVEETALEHIVVHPARLPRADAMRWARVAASGRRDLVLEEVGPPRERRWLLFRVGPPPTLPPGAGPAQPQS